MFCTAFSTKSKEIQLYESQSLSIPLLSIHADIVERVSKGRESSQRNEPCSDRPDLSHTKACSKVDLRETFWTATPSMATMSTDWHYQVSCKGLQHFCKYQNFYFDVQDLYNILTQIINCLKK